MQAREKQQTGFSKEAGLELVRQQIEESCEVKRSFSAELQEKVWILAERSVAAFRGGNKVLLMGNGGSAAEAQHIAAELVGKFRLKRKALPAIALTTNTSTLTAVANDFGYEESFVRQLEALARSKDIVIVISTSGRSRNIVRAVETARDIGCFTAAFTGKSGGDLRDRVDLPMAVPSEDTQRIQEGHNLLGHLYCELVEGILSRSE